MSIPPAITALLARTTELGALLKTWGNVNSGSRNAEGLGRMGVILKNHFARSFPKATIEELPADAEGWNPPGVKAVRIRLRPQAPNQVLLCGHFDTVYEPTDPFQTCRWLDETTLNGPGVSDMKGGIIVLLAALEAFEQTPNAEQLGWEVLLTPDEETGSHGTADLLRAAVDHHQFGLVFEPARPSGDIVHSRKGTGQFAATCHGRAAHAAKVPTDARNAVIALAEFLIEVQKIPAEMPGVLVNVANFHGGAAATNIVPALARSEIDVRVTRAVDCELLVSRIQAEAAKINAREGFRLDVSGGFNRPPKECASEEEAVYAHWQRAVRDLGLTPFNWVHTGGASDGNFLSEGGLPNLDGLGPLGENLHTNREFCRVETIAPRAQIVALFLHRVASSEVVLPPIGAGKKRAEGSVVRAP